jgi:hypothetical protein
MPLVLWVFFSAEGVRHGAVDRQGRAAVGGGLAAIKTLAWPTCAAVTVARSRLCWR